MQYQKDITVTYYLSIQKPYCLDLKNTVRNLH